MPYKKKNQRHVFGASFVLCVVEAVFLLDKKAASASPRHCPTRHERRHILDILEIISCQMFHTNVISQTYETLIKDTTGIHVEGNKKVDTYGS